jgi:prepilin-type N-terminal cleavage/methylation domain-containing protein
LAPRMTCPVRTSLSPSLMIPAAAIQKTRTNGRGFTLLELVIVMVLIGLVIGGAIGLFVISSSERQLKNIAAEMELFSKRARTLALVQQIPYALTFSEQTVRLGPLVEAGYSDDELRERQQFEKDRGTAATTPKFTPVRETKTFSDYAISVKRWGAVNWYPTKRADPQVWRFDPNGICEPVSVRLEYKSGWVEMDFHPLSGGVREQRMEARK